MLSACAQLSECLKASGPKKYRLGNPAPLLYGIYQGKDVGGLTYKQVIYDVLYGNNTPVVTKPTPTPNPSPYPVPTGYSAGKGYDLVTGVGVPFVGHLIDAVIKNAGVP